MNNVMSFEQYYAQNISEDMRILKDKPKWFYLVVSIQKAWDSLVDQKFIGVKGISDNPGIINHWMDVRNTLLVMNAEEFLKLNPSMTKVDYDNPNQLISNNFAILKRLIQEPDRDKIHYYWRVINTILRNTERANKSGKLYDLIKFLVLNEHNITEVFEEHIKAGSTINSLWDFTNVVFDNLIAVINKYNSQYKYRPYDEKSLTDIADKNTLYYIFQQGVLNISRQYVDEGEWLIKPDKITGERVVYIPDNSKLYFKLTVNDPEELTKYNLGIFRYGLSDEEMDLVTDLIAEYKLDEIYDVNFVEGHLKLYDIMKDEPSSNVIPYGKLMKSIKGFPKRKKRSKKVIHESYDHIMEKVNLSEYSNSDLGLVVKTITRYTVTTKYLTLYDFKNNIIYAHIEINDLSSVRKSYEVQRVFAKKNWGPIIYDCAMKSVYPLSLTPNKTIKPAALSVWQFYYENRPDVTKKVIRPSDSRYHKEYYDVLGSKPIIDSNLKFINCDYILKPDTEYELLVDKGIALLSDKGIKAYTVIKAGDKEFDKIYSVD